MHSMCSSLVTEEMLPAVRVGTTFSPHLETQNSLQTLSQCGRHQMSALAATPRLFCHDQAWACSLSMLKHQAAMSRTGLTGGVKCSRHACPFCHNLALYSKAAHWTCHGESPCQWVLGACPGQYLAVLCKGSMSCLCCPYINGPAMDSSTSASSSRCRPA